MTISKRFKLTENPYNKEKFIRWWCNGCKMAHVIPVTGQRAWIWNGSLETPTLHPSVKLEFPKFRDGKPENVFCHLFLVQGKLQYQGDCTHDLRGQTVETPEWPKEYEE